MASGLLIGLLQLGLTALIMGAVAALVPSRRFSFGRIGSYGCGALGSVALAAVGLIGLVWGRRLDLGSFAVIQGLVELRFEIDALSAFFLLLIASLSAAASVYGIGYTAGQDDSSALSPALLGTMWNLFIGSMAAVALAADGFSFLLMWELMSISSFLLVMAGHQDPEVRKAGYFYAVMTHLGTACLVGAFATFWGRAGSLDFEAFRTTSVTLSGLLRNALFLSGCVGFGIKAGLVPLHGWLPRAHPAAPSHVSALMSGAMVKTAIYGLMRFVFDILGPGPTWWGGLLIFLGAVTAVIGALYATQQSHLKRLLAYSTIENVGLLVTVLGAALVARSAGLVDLAALALGALLFHSMGHAAFKGLAFMGAGAVLHGAGTADMERMGGLIRTMPRTALFVLVAVMGMAGLPLFSGFIGEWLSLQTLLQLAREGTTFMQRIGAFAGVGAIALTAGLAAVAAVKAFGISFLALPRSKQAEHAHDASPFMTVGMLPLAAVVVVLGIVPGPAMGAAKQVVVMVLGASPTPVVLVVGSHSLQPLYALMALVGLGLLVALSTWVLGRGRPRWRRSDTWTCGIEPAARMEYSAAGFSKPILLMFRGLLQPVRSLRADRPVHPLFPGEVRYHTELKANLEIYLYRPVTQAVLAVASRLRRVQTGSLQTYLMYLLLAAVGLIIWAR